MIQFYTLATILLWGFADLFYKKANAKEDKDSHLKTVITVGIVMGVQVLVTLIINNFDFNWMAIIKYLPVSLCYIGAMAVGYFGYKYIELSIASPIGNTSGAVATVLCLAFGFCTLSINEIIGLILIVIGIISLAIIDAKSDRENVELGLAKYKTSFIAISLPIFYCLFDALGTFLDAIYLDYQEILTENEALLSYEITFFIIGIILFAYLKLAKKESFKEIFRVNNITAAIFETLGQITYVYALASNSAVVATVVSSYCVISLLLSKVILKERLTKAQYLWITAICLGIVLTV